MDRRPRLPIVARSAPAILLLLLLVLATAARAATAPEFDQATRLTMTGDLAGAAREYESFLARSPQDRLAPVAAMASVNLHLRSIGDTMAAERLCDRILNDYPTCPYAPEAARRKGEIAQARGDWSRAGNDYALALDAASKMPGGGASDTWMNEVAISAADAFFRAGDRPKVVETYNKVLSGSPSPEVAAMALCRLGEAYEETGEMARAAASYAEVVRRHPASTVFDRAAAKRPLIDEHAKLDWGPILAYQAGSRMIAARDYDGASRNADSLLALALEPALAECVEYRKITLDTQRSGDYTAGCGKLREYMARHPDGQRTELARRTLEQQWSPIADLEEQARRTPTDAAAYRRLGMTCVQAGLGLKAVDALERSEALEPENPQTRLYLGYAYATAGRREDAVKAFDFYLGRNPNDTNALNLIGYSYLGLGQPDQAIRYFERYAQVQPDDPNAHDSLGEGYLNAGRLEDAAREYEKAIALDPSFANSYFMLGDVYRRMGKADPAIKAYEDFLKNTATGPQAEEARTALNELTKR